MKPTPESIMIKRLGPIAEARIDPGPLTIAIYTLNVLKINEVMEKDNGKKEY